MSEPLFVPVHNIMCFGHPVMPALVLQLGIERNNTYRKNPGIEIIE